MIEAGAGSAGGGVGSDAQIHIAFLLGWNEAEREMVRREAPAGVVCHFCGPDGPEPDLWHRVEVIVVGTALMPTIWFDRLPRLRLVQRWGTGRDNIDLAAAAARGVVVAEMPGVNALSVAEFSVAAILALYRHIPEMSQAWAEGRWMNGYRRTESHQLTGKTVGLAGYGAIGQAIGKLLSGFGVELLYTDLVKSSALTTAEPVPLDSLLARSDVLCVQLPLTPETHCLIGEAEIRRMKSGAMIVNVSRAGVVDEAAVRLAVEERRLFAASFDNFDPEPLPAALIVPQRDILATPHVAGGTYEGFCALARRCFDETLASRAGRPTG